MKLYFLICTLVLIATSSRTHGFYYGEEDDDSSSGINKTFTGTYLIVAPKNVRPGLPYAVSVNYLKTEDSKPISINLRILDENNKTVVQKVEDVHAGKPVTVKIDKVPNTLVDGIQYRLRVSGQDHSKKQLFENDRRLNYNAKGLSVFVQSDKKMYKPGSAVHFRVVCVYPDLKPYKGVANIKVTDPNQNVLMKFGNVSFEHGVIGKEDKMKIQLTEEPPLGEWKITVDVAGQKTEYDFTVDKYVLPKFAVTVKPPPYMLLTDDLAVTVSAKYTYGKGVAGTATLLIEFPYYWYRDEEKPKSISKTIDLDKNGEVIIRIPNGALKENKLLNTENYWSNNLQLTATVTEGLTGIQRNGTASVSAYKQPYNVEISKQGETFQPGLDYTYTVVVKTKDDKPLPESANHKINMTVNYLFPYTTDENGTSTRNEPIVQSEEITLDKDGTKSVTIRTLNNATSISIQANYNNQNETSTSYELRPSTYIEASKSPTQSYLQITQESASVHAGDVAKFKVKATGANIKALTAQVMTRGYMVFIKNVDVKDHNANVEIPTTNEMAPKSRLIVYGIRSDNKEIIVSAMDLKVEGLFRNNVSISVEPHRAEPNDNVTFNVKASPKSYVGLLAVDQSVLLLKSGNDITQQDVESDIAQYDGSGYWPWRGRRKRSICWRCGWWGISGKDAATIFDNSGVLVLTDAFLYREPQPPRPPYDLEYDSEVMMESAVAVPLSGDDNRRNSLPKSVQPEVTVRRKFPETWIWADVINGEDGHASFKANVPDTITSWITTAFAMHDEDGLGVGPEPAKLEVFRPFFIRLNLPYSVKRGEKLALQVLVFNYMTDEQTVTVTLDHNEHSPFNLLDKPGATKDKKSKDLATRIVKVAGNQGSASVFFPIVPTKVGDIKLLVKAFAQTASDAVEEKLIVEAEGFPIYKNKPFVVDLSSKDSWTTSIQLDIPQNVVPGSQKATVAFVGDIMGSLLENIDRLIQMPYGCGEQNMVNFVPNIIVRRYLEATSRLTPEQTEKTKRYMEAGYQRELSYQRDDFSYSAFGKGDKAGSTWLTAFVVRSFHQAKPYIHVDEDKLKESIKFLKTQQKENGAFGESGEVHSKALQGGSGSGGPPLTAYVYLALVENDVKNPEALNYLERSLERASNDSYTLALISYALHLANSSKKDDAFKALEKTAIEKDGSKYWSQKVGGSDAKDAPWWDQPKPVDVEMTAYALLTYVLRKDVSGAVPLVRWLVSKQNSYGGYSSTQDTVVALQALGAYAEKAYTPNIEVSATVKNGDQKHTFNVKKDNAIILQQYQISNLDKPVEINANGKGISFGHVGWHYNLLQLADSQPFVCSKNVSQTSSNDILLNMCCKYNLEGRSNMALMQVESPSGFIIDQDKLNKLTEVHDLQRVETERNNQQANIYFNSVILSNEQICFNVSAERQFFVSEQKPANVKLIDYYHPSHQIAFDYSISKKLDLNEVCGGDCWKDMGKGNTGDNIVYANSDSLSLPSSSENLAICQCLKFVLTLLLPLFLIYA